MLKIGITGGIGSGKSLVSKILLSMNFPVFNSDREAKKIIHENSSVKTKLITLFGEEVFINDKLNRPFLANIIFNDEQSLKKVNAIIHPLVRETFENFTKEQSREFVFNEAAILFESGGNQQMDKTILISAPKELRIKRVMLRDKTSREDVLSRMNKQWSDDQKRVLADFEIVNDEKRPLMHQVETTLMDLGKV